MAMGHVIFKEFHLEPPSEYFTDYIRRLTDMPMLVTLTTGRQVMCRNTSCAPAS